MEQKNYDTQTLLPAIKDILSKESAKSDKLSNELTNLGNNAKTVALQVSDINTQVNNNKSTVDKLLQKQQEGISTCEQILNILDKSKLDGSVIAELKVDLIEKIDKLFSQYEGSDMKITDTITKVYGEYRDAVTSLSSEIAKLTLLLTDADRNNQLSAVENDVVNLQSAIMQNNAQYQERFEAQMKSLVALANEVDEIKEVVKEIKQASQTRNELVSSVSSRIYILESRLDVLFGEKFGEKVEVK